MAGTSVLTRRRSRLGTPLIVPASHASNEEIVKTAGGVPYVSEGIGTDSIDRLSSLAGDFNLKLVFALTSAHK